MSYRGRFIFVMSLTMGRIPLILVFLIVNILFMRWNEEAGRWALMSPGWHTFWFVVAFGSMVMSALTDLFDGYFARRLEVTTSLGAYADPLTDKIFYLTAFPVLIFLATLHTESLLHARLLLALTVIFLMRDQWISFLRSIGSIHKVSAKANWSGKARTIISFPMICTVYWYLASPQNFPLQLPAWFIYFFEAVALVINLISIWVYTRNYWPWLLVEAGFKDKETVVKE